MKALILVMVFMGSFGSFIAAALTPVCYWLYGPDPSDVGVYGIAATSALEVAMLFLAVKAIHKLAGFVLVNDRAVA